MTFNHSHILKFKGKNDFLQYNINYDNLLTLKEAGLLHESDILNVTFGFLQQFKGSFLFFANIPIILSHKTNEKFTFDQIALTKSAIELCSIIPLTPNIEYLNAIMEEKKQEGYEFKILITQTANPIDNENPIS